MSSVSVSSDENVRPKGRNGGVRGSGAKRGTATQGELATKVLLVQSKRFFLDVKENDRGRFIKFAALTVSGKKNRIFMSMRTANQLKDYLGNFISISQKSTATTEETEPKLIHSETIVNDKRRYYIDLRENNRGQFLRFTQISVQVGHRFSVSMPAQGLEELRTALGNLIDEFAEDGINLELPEGRSLRSESKTFYFDPDQNDRGIYLKISEVKPTFGHRSTITISARALPQFVAVLNDLQAKIGKLGVFPSAPSAKDKAGSSANEPDVDGGDAIAEIRTATEALAVKDQ